MIPSSLVSARPANLLNHGPAAPEHLARTNATDALRASGGTDKARARPIGSREQMGSVSRYFKLGLGP